MSHLSPDIFEKPWLLLCEGESDKRFFERLMEARNITSNFEVQFPGRGKSGVGGRGGFGRRLKAVSMGETFKANVKTVLIVSDNDNNMKASFKAVQREIEKATGFPIPAVERVVARATEFPSVVILMIPMGECGNLETLCLHAAETKWRLTAALDTFVAATPAKGWPLSKQSKMRLQTTLAATCRKKPDTSFAQHWCEHSKYRIPVTDPCFDSIACFLENFGDLLA